MRFADSAKSGAASDRDPTIQAMPQRRTPLQKFGFSKYSQIFIWRECGISRIYASKNLENANLAGWPKRSLEICVSPLALCPTG
jgi:hypothetical protein